jgi:hypothetical protein
MRKLLLMSFLLLVSACDGSSSIGMPQPGLLEAEFSVLDKFGVETDQFTVGEPITFRLTISNHTVSSIAYSAARPDSDVVVQQGTNVIWSYHFGEVFPAIVDTAMIDAGETVAGTFEWNGTDLQGNQVSPGQYEVIPLLNWWVNDVALTVLPATRTIVLQ